MVKLYSHEGMERKFPYTIYENANPVTVGITFQPMPSITYKELGKLIEDLVDLRTKMWPLVKK